MKFRKNRYRNQNKKGISVFAYVFQDLKRDKIKTLFGVSPLIGKGFYPVYPLTFKKAEELIAPLNFSEKEIIPYHNDGKLNIMPIRNLSSHIIVRMVK